MQVTVVNDCADNSEFCINRSMLEQMQLEVSTGGHFYAQKDYLVERSNMQGVYLLLYTLSGYGCLTYRGNHHFLYPDTGVLINREEFHRYFTSSQNTNWEFKWVQFAQNGRLLQDATIFQRITGPTMLERALVEPFFDSMISGMQNGVQNSVLTKALSGLLTLFFNHKPTYHRNDVSIPDNVMECRFYIEQHFAKPMSVDDLAKQCHMAKSAFIRKFRHYFGITPYVLLQETRLQRGAKLLSSTGLPVKEIALSVGYLDHNNFTKQFKAHFQISPSEYRQQTNNAI